MAWYIYPPMVAVDATGALLNSGTGQIFAEDDLLAATPLPLRDLSDAPLASVSISSVGLTQAFQVEVPECVWRSGEYAVALSSAKGMRNAAEAAQTAAEAAQVAAEAAAAGAVDIADLTISPGSVWSSQKVNDELALKATSGSSLAETIRDVVAGALVPGSNVNIISDDILDTITISATGGTGAGAVASVNGQIGDVVLVAADVDALPDTYAPSWGAVTGKPATFPPEAHSAALVTSGIVAPARLGTGTPDTTKFLRGDGTWQTTAEAEIGAALMNDLSIDHAYVIVRWDALAGWPNPLPAKSVEQRYHYWSVTDSAATDPSGVDGDLWTPHPASAVFS